MEAGEAIQVSELMGIPRQYCRFTWLSVTTNVVSLGAAMLATWNIWALVDARGLSLVRCQFIITAAALNGVPSLKVTPERSVIVQVMPSSEVKSVASRGSIESVSVL